MAVAGVALVIVLVSACSETLQQETGVVVGIESPTIGQVDGFELLTEDGRTVRFDTSELPFRPEFPAAHLNEHRVLGEPIVVTYRDDGERHMVTRLADA